MRMYYTAGDGRIQVARHNILTGIMAVFYLECLFVYPVSDIEIEVTPLSSSTDIPHG